MNPDEKIIVYDYAKWYDHWYPVKWLIDTECPYCGYVNTIDEEYDRYDLGELGNSPYIDQKCEGCKKTYWLYFR